jgi:hypothetical protein
VFYFNRPGSVICFNNVEELNEAYANAYQPDVRGNFTDPYDIKDFYDNMGKFENNILDLGERCSNVSTGQHVEYVGTVATVRDMVALADVLEGSDELINYWGFS